MLLASERGRNVVEPVADKPVVVAAPPATAPAQAPDAEVAVRVAVDGAPEEDEGGVAVRLLLPLLGDGVGGASR